MSNPLMHLKKHMRLQCLLKHFEVCCRRINGQKKKHNLYFFDWVKTDTDPTFWFWRGTYFTVMQLEYSMRNRVVSV